MRSSGGCLIRLLARPDFIAGKDPRGILAMFLSLDSTLQPGKQSFQPFNLSFRILLQICKLSKDKNK